MSKRQFKSQASSSRAATGAGFGGFGSTSVGSTLSYLSETPNLSSISDPNVVVCFKNLSKKDGTTKSKGLEDLRTYVQAHPYELDGGTEESVLEAWVKFYPRLSIDNSRRVRELSHNLQYELLKSARKRMEKHIPKIVGSWLAGTYDRDRAVSRAALDGISSFLDNEKKIIMFWKRCQIQILDYAQDAINETPQTLSDERTMTAEDLQAKFFRVVGSSISLVLSLLDKLDAKDVEQNQDKYDGFLSNNKTLWSLASCEDSFVRRTVFQLLAICLEKQTQIIEADLKIISHAFITEGLRVSQSSSALQLLQSLVRLTHQFPQIWTSAYQGKKSPLSRLRHFVQKGSQGGPAVYWQSLNTLIGLVPSEVLPEDVETSLDFLDAFRNGIASREEPRSNAEEAWSSYFATVNIFAGKLSDPISYGKLHQKALYPVFDQYLHPTTDNSKWSVASSTSALAKAYQTCASTEIPELKKSFSDEWSRLSEDFVTRLKTSLPEQSKDYHKSQAAVLAESHRWFSLLRAVLQTRSSREAKDVLIAPSVKLLIAALEVNSTREGKPYSAAATVEAALRLTPILMEISALSLESLRGFLKADLARLILSPSSKYLISILFLFRGIPGQELVFEELWQSTVSSLSSAQKFDHKNVVVELISNVRNMQLKQLELEEGSSLFYNSKDSVARLAQSNFVLEEFLVEVSKAAILDVDATEAWVVLEAAITFDSLQDSTQAQLLNQIIELLGTNTEGALKALEVIAKKKPGILKQDNKIYVSLITKLLALSELSESAIPSQAARLQATIEASDKTNQQEAKSPILHVIRENLENATTQSLTVETLVQQAESVLAVSKSSAALLPDVTIWQRTLRAHLSTAPNPALGVMRPFAGALFLARNFSGKDSTLHSRDINGYSIPLRMAMYTTRLLGAENAPVPDLEILYLLSITTQLVQDQVDLQAEDQLFSSLLDPDVAADLQEFLFSASQPLNKIISAASGWLDESGAVMESGASYSSGLIRFLIPKLIQETSTNTPTAFHAARILSNVLQRLINDHGWHNVHGEEWLQGLDLLKSSTKNILGAAAILIGLQDILGTSKLVNNLCNRLISDIAGASAQSEKTLGQLVLLNASFTVYEEGDLPVAQNRLVFAVKQILSWADTIPTTYSSLTLASEACYSLHRLLPAIKDVYGSYWESALGFCLAIWDSSAENDLSDARLPMIGMSLKLYTILKNLKDANDDLDEALSQYSEQISNGLVNILKLRRSKENVPTLFIDNMLSREIQKLPLGHIQETVTDFYPLVASEFRTVQSSAFDVLHRAIPEVQQQISVDVLLEKRDAQLPEELLSLLLDAPTFNDFSDEVLLEFPTSIRGYLLSWLLVFDSYSNASFKVRNDYSEVLKSENYIGPLLSFMFDVFGHSEGRPMNLTSFEASKIRAYDIWEANDTESNERSMHWLLVHIYYLCLKYTSSLAKNWWLDCKSKQLRLAVESWTERFFSPLIIEDTMGEVMAWAAGQETTDDEKELVVKAAKRSREVHAAYEVDDMMMQIVIRLPPNYPLQGVKVEGVNRVAATERKWTGWLMNTQGAMTFDNGSITDGLTIFRKNVVGTLKGKAECAICYSLISSDKKMPDKGCHTCKNLFHAACLFKWFATSNQSTCPLCRNPFNYGVEPRRARAGQ